MIKSTDERAKEFTLYLWAKGSREHFESCCIRKINVAKMSHRADGGAGHWESQSQPSLAPVGWLVTADTGHVTDPVPLCQLLWRRARSDCGAESSLFGPGWCLVQGGERSERNASRAEEFGATSSGHTVLLQEWISKLSSQGTTRHRRTRVVDLDSQGSLQLRRVSPGAPGRSLDVADGRTLRPSAACSQGVRGDVSEVPCAPRAPPPSPALLRRLVLSSKIFAFNNLQTGNLRQK